MEETKTVRMSAEEQAQFEAFKAEQERKRMAEEKRAQRQMLQQMTDEVMDEAVGILRGCNEQLREAKRRVIETFSTLMELRKEVNSEEGKREQDSYMFTSSDGMRRIRIGYNMQDNYLDQVEEGIGKLRSYLQSLAKDEESQQLIDLVMRLLARDTKGNLKASRVIQLGQLAERSGDEEFMEGIRIIREAYRPTRSKLYIRCSERKAGSDDGWQDMALSLAEV